MKSKRGFSWKDAKTYYEQPVIELELQIRMKGLSQMSDEIGLSINTLQKMRKGEDVTGKSWSKLRIWWLNQASAE